jgi:RND family efflux transporter MFP subunit
MKIMKPGAALLCALAIASLSACGRHEQEEVDSETAVPVKTEPATRGDIRGVVHASGIVDPAPDADLVVVAPEVARIVEIPHATGDTVHKGDLLVRFEIPSSSADVQKQRAEVARSEASLENARFAQTRSQALFERGVAARKEVEEADRAASEAEAMLTEARASLGAAQTVAARSTVRATFDGVVAKRYHNPGDLVEAAASDPVLRVVDPRRLEVLAAIPLAEASRVRPGAAARLVAGPAGATDAALTVVSHPAAVDPGTATAPARLSFTGVVDIPVGTPVQVEVDAEQHRGVVLIPIAALVREGEETFAFVAIGGKAKRRAVKVGLTGEDNVEIVSGIAAGEAVIVNGQAGLPDDAPVTAAAEGEGGGAEKPDSGAEGPAGAGAKTPAPDGAGKDEKK